MSDLAKYVRARADRESEFADGFEAGYAELKAEVLIRQVREQTRADLGGDRLASGDQGGRHQQEREQ